MTPKSQRAFRSAENAWESPEDRDLFEHENESMSNETIPSFMTVAEANRRLPNCPRKCSECLSRRGHHWYLDFEGDEGENRQAVICGHCEQRALIAVHAEDLPEV